MNINEWELFKFTTEIAKAMTGENASKKDISTIKDHKGVGVIISRAGFHLHANENVCKNAVHFNISFPTQSLALSFFTNPKEDKDIIRYFNLSGSISANIAYSTAKGLVKLSTQKKDEPEYRWRNDGKAAKLSEEARKLTNMLLKLDKAKAKLDSKTAITLIKDIFNAN